MSRYIRGSLMLHAKMELFTPLHNHNYIFRFAVLTHAGQVKAKLVEWAIDSAARPVEFTLERHTTDNLRVKEVVYRVELIEAGNLQTPGIKLKAVRVRGMERLQREVLNVRS